MAQWEIARATREKWKASVHPHQHRLGRQESDARGRELDAQRQPVESMTDLGNRWRALLGHDKVGLRGLCALDKESDSLVLRHVLDRGRRGARRQRQGR